MNELIVSHSTDVAYPYGQSSQQKTITSLELREIINQCREAAGEQPIRLNKFNEKIDDELDGDHYTKSVVQNPNNTESVVYNLTLDQCTLVGMRESKAVRRNVLEVLKRKQSGIPETYADALQLAADQAKQLALAAPKVAYFDQVADRSNLMNATQVAQKFGMSAVVMNRHLDKLGVYNQTVKRSRVFSTWFEQKGYGELKQTESGYPQAMFTTAGEQWIFQKFVSEGIING